MLAWPGSGDRQGFLICINHGAGEQRGLSSLRGAQLQQPVHEVRTSLWLQPALSDFTCHVTSSGVLTLCTVTFWKCDIFFRQVSEETAAQFLSEGISLITLGKNGS